MKRLLFFIGSLWALSGNSVLAKEAAKASEVHPLTHFKVSKINANLFTYLYEMGQDIWASFVEGFVSLKDFVETGEWILKLLETAEMQEYIVSFVFRMILSLIFGLILSISLGYILKNKIKNMLHCRHLTTVQKQKRLFFATLLTTLAPLVFGISFYSFYRLISPPDLLFQEIMRIISSGIVTIWILLNIAHIFLKPPSPDHKHLPLSKEVLSVTYRWLFQMGIVALFGFYSLEVGRLIDLPRAGERLLVQGTGLVIAILAVFMVLALHKEIKEWIAGQRKDPRASKLKRAMLPYLEYSYIPTIVFIVISYVSWVTHEAAEFQIVVWKSLITLSLFPLLRYASYCLRKGRLLIMRRNLKKLTPNSFHKAIFYGKQIDFVTIVLLNGLALLFVLDLWRLTPEYFFFTEIGKWIAEKVLSIFLIITAAIFLTRAGNGILTKYLTVEETPTEESHRQLVARYNTLHNVGLNALRVAIWTPAILLIIVELDIDIMPILATAGILAAGIGFGVNSFVKDFVSGFFMLLEDTFAIGDEVAINGVVGYVESLTVRVVRLRDPSDGSIYTYPYGSITSVSNQTRDYSNALLLVQVGIDADINEVYKILNKISDELQKDPAVSKMILAPININGVSQVDNYSIQIRGIMKTKAGMNGAVKRAFNYLLKQYLESNKIPRATPQSMVFNYGIEK